LIRWEPNSAAGHGSGIGCVGVARTPPQNNPASKSSSAVNGTHPFPAAWGVKHCGSMNGEPPAPVKDCGQVLSRSALLDQSNLEIRLGATSSALLHLQYVAFAGYCAIKNRIDKNRDE
jgi:hypothetical protein